MTTTTAQPYGAAAPTYRARGWDGVLPLPAGAKKFPPKGYTGRHGEMPTPEQITAWTTAQADGNVALRVPDGVLGIDVDAYGEKTGAADLAARESEWGALPPTVMSTSRDDGVSGIRFYRVPTGLAWPSDLGPSIEVVRFAHRYAVVAPSLHPEGRAYQWLTTDGASVEFPCPEGLPALPDAWVAGMTGGTTARTMTGGKATPTDLEEFLDALPTGPPSEDVASILAEFLVGFESNGHRAMLRATRALLSAGDLGERGVAQAVETVREHFLTGKGAAREHEFDRALCGALDLVREQQDAYARLTFTAEDLVPAQRVESASHVESTWAPVDLGPYLDGTFTPTMPTLMPREDGICLLYPGLTHSFHGESESGKSMVLQVETARLLKAGRPVLFLDFESDPASVIQRLRTFGVETEQIRRHFYYVRPDDNLSSEAAQAQWRGLVSRPYDLAVIDGVTASLGLFGYTTKDNDEVTAWDKHFPRVIAEKTGAAVVMVDHVTKSGDRGRFAIGGQAKMSNLTGAAYTVEILTPLGVGTRGSLSLRVGKDRPGQIRPHAGDYRKSDRTQEVVRVTIDSTVSPSVVTFEAPPKDGGASHEFFESSALKETISKTVENAPEALSGKGITDAVKGNRAKALAALETLVAEGYITRTKVGAAFRHTSARPFRATADDVAFAAVDPF